MKVTKEYLRELIRESLEEVASLTRAQRAKLRQFGKNIPSGGMPMPQSPDSELVRGRWQIIQLTKNTGVLRTKDGKEHRTDLMPKGFYVYHFDGLSSEMYGPFPGGEPAARDYVLKARSEASAEVGREIASGSEEDEDF